MRQDIHVQQDIQQVVDFDSAVLAHAEWKLKLNQYIIGEGKLSPAPICQDNLCLLGRWIYGAGQRFVGNPLFEPMRTAHARFHQTAAKVVEAVDAGDIAGAKKMIADDSVYVAVSKEVIAYLFKLKDDILNITNKLIENVDVGFFLIGQDCRIKPSYSKVCLRLLKKDAIENLVVTEALGLSERDADYLLCQLSQVFADELPEEITLGQIPQRMTTPTANIQVAVRVLRDASGGVSELLFTLHDITRLMETEDENRQNRMLLNLAMQKESFRGFLIDTSESLQSAIEAIRLSRQEIARRNLHTIKGNSGFYGLDALVSAIHGVEDKVSITLDDVAAIDDHLRGFVESIEWVTGPLLSSEKAETSMPLASIERLGKVLQSGDLAAVAAVARALLTEANEHSARDLLGPFERACEVLARRFEKSVRVELVNPEMRYSKNEWGPVFHNLVHLLRNAVDHGVEAPSERAAKPEQAVVRLKFLANEIVFADDGRGIDVDAVVARAVDKGFVTATGAAALSRAQQLELILVDGVSTAKAITETSGRGVGMSALRDAIEQAGGHVVIETEAGRGTTFRLTANTARG